MGEKPQKDTGQKVKEFFQGVLGLLVIIGVISMFVGGGEDQQSTETVQERTDNAHSEQSAAPQIKRVPASVFGQAVSSIKQYPAVRDAAVSQEGNQLSLAVIVGAATNESHAKELGDNFVRMVMTSLAGSDLESAPTKTLGFTRFNYMITVATPTKKVLAQGAKAQAADGITW